jgi:hypothetical protein
MGSETSGYTSLNEGLNFDRMDVRRNKIDWKYWPDTSNQENYEDDSLLPGEGLHRPDIEDEGLICWGLAESQRQLKEAGAVVDVLCVDGADPRMYLGAMKIDLIS